uniref:Protochlorophyllide reductase n=1 Tax=Rhodosorus marinus TaxID=101924 RepID=A0A7S2ZQD8_9RHOD|mmetsp:Transcript_28235/g.110895  ORF Transcript_28235/g.110895 Transcript_28235/m.110895 type:complete len:308 (+) Transcript_28235:468-1391(+)|eukprot:CAMPEP_0113955960 /NCGR_PEP_ID=MMETSP0011_2-20120614/1748_1 /TAXON_ID=101924 /ORGANISM="Rhodosorus marinus" /LENGTH=307 /DNA_ID=CAMNT_0000965957 /DNA_START=230 /DNA_END=1153 /DNA_ORIENTATION=+ /assembly_acc=CAM_ASM_000156
MTKTKEWSTDQIEDQSGKVVIVTGGNAGMGFQMVKALALKHAHVIIASRSEEKGLAAVAEIRKLMPDAKVDFMKVDLSSFKSIKEFVSAYQEKKLPLHLLINNAGVADTPHSKTVDGYEVTIGVNHLGPFLLTVLLLDTLKKSAPARVVTLSSISAGDVKELHLDDFTAFAKSDITNYDTYGVSKMYNLLFSVHLDKVLEGTGVHSFSVHPGFVKTDMMGKMETSMSSIMKRILVKFLGQSPEMGATSALYCGTTAEVIEKGANYMYGSNKYLQGNTIPNELSGISPLITQENMEKLWDKTKAEVGV